MAAASTSKRKYRSFGILLPKTMPNCPIIFGVLFLLFLLVEPVHAQVGIAPKFPKPTPKKSSEKQASPG